MIIVLLNIKATSDGTWVNKYTYKQWKESIYYLRIPYNFIVSVLLQLKYNWTVGLKQQIHISAIWQLANNCYGGSPWP